MEVYKALRIIPSDEYLKENNKFYITRGCKVKYMLVMGLRENDEWENLGSYDFLGLMKTDGFSKLMKPLRMHIVEKNKQIMFELFTYDTHRIVLKEKMIRFEFDVMKKEDVIIERL